LKSITISNLFFQNICSVPSEFYRNVYTLNI